MLDNRLEPRDARPTQREMSSSYARRQHALRPGTGALKFDLDGIIRCCTLPVETLTRSAPGALVGTEIRALVPDLPVRSNTPGYNLAACITQSGQASQPLRVQAADGATLSVRGTLHRVATNDTRLFLLELRWG